MELKLEAPAPGLCMAARADTGVPPLTDLALATPFAVAEAGGPLTGELVGGSVEALRPVAALTGGFFVAADICMVL